MDMGFRECKGRAILGLGKQMRNNLLGDPAIAHDLGFEGGGIPPVGSTPGSGDPMRNMNK